MVRYSEYETGLIGMLTLTASEDGSALTGCWFENDRFYNGPRTAEMERDDDLPVLAQARAWLRQRVWRILLEIPYGQTVTYGDIAQRLAAESGGKMSAQAVGGAVGHNPIGVIIPCHRVMGAKGNLTGFGGGIATKVKLLEHEKTDMEGFYVPKKGTAL